MMCTHQLTPQQANFGGKLVIDVKFKSNFVSPDFYGVGEDPFPLFRI